MTYKRSVDDLVTVKEAAEILEISEKQVRSYIRDGSLAAQYPEGRKLSAPTMIHREELAGLAEFLRSDMSIPKLMAIARRAHIASRSLERVVRRINAATGANVPIADLSKEAVVATYLQVEEALEEYKVRSPEEITRWSRVFLAAGEEYFEAVAQHTGDQQPWKKFLDLAVRIRKEAPVTIADTELSTAYGYFAAAARFMRQAAYFYVRNHHGLPVASSLFPETADDLVAPVLLMADAER